MGQKQKPEVFYKVPTPTHLLYMCVFFIYLLKSISRPPTKQKKSQCIGKTVPLCQHVIAFICDLASVLPQAGRQTYTHTLNSQREGERDPCSGIRKVSSPIQAVTKMTLCPEGSPVTKPVHFSQFTADLLQKTFILLPDLRQTAALCLCSDFRLRAIRCVLICLHQGFSFISILFMSHNTFRKCVLTCWFYNETASASSNNYKEFISFPFNLL